MAETLWKSFNAGTLALAKGGAEGVQCHFSVSVNDCLTRIATVNGKGEKQPLWIPAKGKTKSPERCYAKVTDEKDLHIDHSPNGQTNRQVASRHLRWLPERNGQMAILLIWVGFTAHRDQKVKDLAKKLNIRLIFIRANEMNEYGPLDRRIFDPMKQRARKQSRALFLQDCAAQLGMPEALECMISVWNRIHQNDFLLAWDHLTDESSIGNREKRIKENHLVNNSSCKL
jgi:hypothetical protein